MNRRKILVFGSQGMFGHVAVEYFQCCGNYEVVPCARSASAPGEISVDVTDFAHVRKILTEQRPDIVLNCIGMLVQACADHTDRAILINSYFSHFLAEVGKELNFKLVHLSTDCVFSGKRGGYRDGDFRDGDTPYARTKALGEVVDDRNLTVRTSIIGPELKGNGTGLFSWFMRQRGTVKGYSRVYWSGVTTLELAKFIHAALRKQITGLYQLSMPEKISKYDLLKLFQEVWAKADVSIESFDEYFCDKSMISERTDFVYSLPVSYREMLMEMKEWMNRKR